MKRRRGTAAAVPARVSQIGPSPHGSAKLSVRPAPIDHAALPCTFVRRDPLAVLLVRAVALAAHGISSRLAGDEREPENQHLEPALARLPAGPDHAGRPIPTADPARLGSDPANREAVVTRSVWHWSRPRHEHHHELARARHVELVAQHPRESARRLAHPCFQATQVFQPVYDAERAGGDAHRVAWLVITIAEGKHQLFRALEVFDADALCGDLPLLHEALDLRAEVGYVRASAREHLELVMHLRFNVCHG